MIKHDVLLDWLDDTLSATQFQDYSPNGLQVAGTSNVKTVVSAVTASLAAIEFAIEKGADMLLVHHGMFWKNEPVTITGWKKNRIAALLRHNINLVAYHLPLDVHPTLGNNACLAQIMHWLPEKTVGEYGLLNIGTLPEHQQSVEQLAHALEIKLARKPVVVGDLSGSIERVAWCSGGAQNYFQAAINEGVDVYITGEISEAQYHLANETGVVFISAGHHATERYGVQALGTALAREFGIGHTFFDEPNPA